MYFCVLNIKHSVSSVTKLGTKCIQKLIEGIVLNENINPWPLEIMVSMPHKDIYGLGIFF